MIAGLRNKQCQTIRSTKETFASEYPHCVAKRT
jgi:hypothetical protein